MKHPITYDASQHARNARLAQQEAWRKLARIHEPSLSERISAYIAGRDPDAIWLAMFAAALVSVALSMGGN